MQKKFLRKILFLCFLSSSSFLWQAQAQIGATGLWSMGYGKSLIRQTCTVTAAQYADFLNSVAASDPDHLYDDAMSTDPKAGCITRVGRPGRWRYEVISGRENFPIAYVNAVNENSYCNETGDVISDDDKSGDLFLRSNTKDFQVIAESSSMLTLATSSSKAQSSRKWSAVDFLAVVPFLAVGMMTGDLFTAEEGSLTHPDQQAPFSPERAAITQSLRTAAIKNSSEMLLHYEPNERLWIQTQQAWEDRTTAEQDAISKKELLAIASELRDKKAEIDLDTTLLGRISNYSGKAATVLGFVPCPLPLAGIATTISTATDLINKVWTQADATMAEGKVMLFAYEKETAEQQAREANNQVISLEKTAKTAEADARATAAILAKADAEALRPPSTNINVAAWNAWAEKVVQRAGLSDDKISEIARHGMSDSSWAVDQSASAWLDRVRFSEQNVKIFNAKKNPHETAFKQAESVAKAVRKVANADKRRYEESLQIHADAKKELEEIHNELNELEKPPLRVGVNREIEKKKNKFLAAFRELEAASAELKILGERAVISNNRAVSEEENFSPIRREYEAFKKNLLRNIERVKLQLEVDRAAWKAIWPEKNRVLSQIPRQIGKAETEKFDPFNPIEPPLFYDEDLEVLGRSLLKEQKRKEKNEAAAALKMQASQTITLEATGGEKKEDLATDTTDAITASELDDFSIPEIRIPSDADLARWQARKKADQLIARAQQVAIAWSEKKPAIEDLDELEERESVATAQSKGSTVASFLSKITGIAGGKKKISTAPTIKEGDEDSWEVGSDIDDAEAFAARNAENLAGASKKTGSTHDGIVDTSSELERADGAAEQAIQAWIELVKQAEAKRISDGGIAVPESMALDAWFEADKKGIASLEERRKIEKEEHVAARVEQDWAVNTARWAARAEADEFHATEEEAKTEVVNLMENARATTAASFSESQSAREKVAAAKATSAAAQTKASEAEKKWLAIANQHQYLIATALQDEAAVTSAREKLADADRAVNELYNRFQLSRLNLRHQTEAGNPFSQADEASLEEESTNYKFSMRTKKESCLAQFFREADAAKIAARRKYTGSRVPSARAEAERLYVNVDQLEEEGLKKYAAAAEHDALDAARNKISGAEAVWEDRYKQAVKKAQSARETARAKNDAPSLDYWADDVQRTADRETGIAKADWRAFAAFTRERERLDDIETTWIAAFEASERLAKIKAEQAAKNYADGETDEWHALSPTERTAYNKAVETANKNYEKNAVTTLQRATQKAAQARYHSYKLNKSLFSSSFKKNDAAAVAAKAETELANAMTREASRLALIQWSRLEPSQRTKISFVQLLATQANRLEIDRWSNLTRNQQKAELRFKIAQAEAAKNQYNVNAAKAKAAGKEKEAASWERAGLLTSFVTDRLANAITAQAAGKMEEATSSREAAQRSQLQCENHTKAAEAWATPGKEKEAASWDYAGNSAFIASKRLGKAIIAQFARKMDEAREWREAARWNQLECENHAKAAEAWTTPGKEKEAASWDNAGAGANRASERLAQAITAQAAGKIDEAQEWREAARWSQLRCENDTKAAEAWAIGTSGKEKEASSWVDAGYGAQNASDELEKAIKTQAAGKMEEATQWREVARWSQLRCENKTKAAEAWATPGKEKEARSWDGAGSAALFSSSQLKEAIKAQAAGKMEEATQWREVVRWSQLGCENKTKAAEAWAIGTSGKEKEAESWDDAGTGAYYSASHDLELAMEAQQAGKMEEATQWREVARWRQLGCENHTKAAEAWALGKKKEAVSWDDAGKGADKVSYLLEKAIIAQAAGKMEEATQWREVARWSQLHCENKTKAAGAWATPGKEKEAMSWYHAGTAAENASSLLVDAIYARITGELKEAEHWKDIANNYQRSCYYYAQAAQAYAAGNNEEGDFLNKEGKKILDRQPQFRDQLDQTRFDALLEESDQKLNEAESLQERLDDPFLISQDPLSSTETRKKPAEAPANNDWSWFSEAIAAPNVAANDDWSWFREVAAAANVAVPVAKEVNVKTELDELAAVFMASYQPFHSPEASPVASAHNTTTESKDNSPVDAPVDAPVLKQADEGKEKKGWAALDALFEDGPHVSITKTAPVAIAAPASIGEPRRYQAIVAINDRDAEHHTESPTELAQRVMDEEKHAYLQAEQNNTQLNWKAASLKSKEAKEAWNRVVTAKKAVPIEGGLFVGFPSFDLNHELTLAESTMAQCAARELWAQAMELSLYAQEYHANNIFSKKDELIKNAEAAQQAWHNAAIAKKQARDKAASLTDTERLDAQMKMAESKRNGWANSAAAVRR